MMKLFKRTISAVMAAIVFLSLPYSVFAASFKGSLTDSLSEKQWVATKAAIERANEESMNRVAMNLGRLSSGSIDISHYINKKVLKKGELEAFKWSFIFSQFAIPLQDSLEDVFEQSIFKQMEEQDMAISSVSSILGEGEYMQILDAAGMMLQSTTYKQLKQTIKSNLYYLTLYDKNGAPVTLNDLLSSKCDAGTIYYIYDKVDNTSYNADTINDLYYNQGKLGLKTEYSLTTETKKFPALVYNNATFLYLQTAVGSYCRSHDIDINTLKAQKGSGTLYSDSYGNICVYDGADYRIVVPNFGNSLFMNEQVTGSDYDLEERVFMYNKWLSTCYSQRTRESNQAQADTLTPYILGDRAATTTDDKQNATTTYGDGPAHYFAEFLNVSSTSAKKTDQYESDPKHMKGNLLLIDPPTISATDANYNWSDKGASIVDRINAVGAGSADYLNEMCNFGSATIPSWWGNQGVVMSPSNDGVVGFNPKNGTPVVDKFPIMQGNREMNNAEKDNYWNVTRAFAQILSKGTWLAPDSGVTLTPNSIVDPISGKQLADSTLAAAPTLEVINQCYAAVFGWDYNKLIANPNYLSLATIKDGNWASMMFLKDDIIDYGQTMPIYMADSEKGMYLPYYRMFYTGNTDNLMNGLATASNKLGSLAVSNSTGAVTYNSGLFGSSLYNCLDGVSFTINPTEPSGENSKINGSTSLGNRLKALSKIMDGSTKGFFSKSLKFEDWQSFKAEWNRACFACGLEPESALNVLMSFQNSSASWDLLGDQQFFMSQWYLLPRDNKYSAKLGCNTSEDFVLSTYFWDRYYLTKTPLNNDMQQIIYDSSKPVTDKYKGETWKPYTLQADGSVLDGNGAVVEMAGATAESIKQLNMQTYYNQLPEDAVVLYSRAKSPSHTLRVYYTPQDELFLKATGSGFSGQTVEINYFDTVLALQKNTDYEHNYQVLPVTKEEAVENVTLQELMNNANGMMLNPVKTITTVISGLLYDVHRIVGTGSLGSGFDLNWLVSNPIYLWLSDKFVVIAILIVCSVTLVRVIRYMLIQEHHFANLFRDVVMVIAFSMVPILMLNSFIYIFNFSSQRILKESSYKTMMSQIQMKQGERLNADANVDTELAMFREQFAALEGAYDGMTFRMPDSYQYGTKEISYKDVALASMMDNLKLTWDKPVWYDSRGFVAVNGSHYDDSLFYFYYDYLKSAYLSYYATSSAMSTSTMKTVAERYNYGDRPLAGMDDVAKKDLQVLEQSFAMTNGNFRNMLLDSQYVYGPSALQENRRTYGGPQLRDLFGFYKIFVDDSIAYVDDWSKNIHDSDYFIYMQEQSPLAYTRTINSGTTLTGARTWANYALIGDYDKGRSWLYTSKLDPYNPAINADYSNSANPNYRFTPFEESLVKLNKDIYKDVLQVLDYLPTQMSDEAAITTAALIATFKTNQLFGMEPTAPIMGSLNMDMIMRTTLIKNVANMDSRVNLMYAMLNDGYGVMGILVAVWFESVAAILTGLRIAIMLIVIVTASTYGLYRFASGGAAQNKTMLLGIIGNYIGLIVLHMANAMLINLGISFMSTMLKGIVTSIICCAILSIGMLVLAAAHLWLLKSIFKNFRDLGGVYMEGMVTKARSAMINLQQKSELRASSLAARFGKTHVNSQTQTVDNSTVNVNNGHDMQVNAENVSVNSVSNTLAAMHDAEAKSASTNFVFTPDVEKHVSDSQPKFDPNQFKPGTSMFK